MQAEARKPIDEWVEVRGKGEGPLFSTRSGKAVERIQGWRIIQRMVEQANAHLPEDERVDASPHVLRHTFLRKLAEKHGVQYASEASGQLSDRYIWRYVQPDQESLAEPIDDIEQVL